MNVSDFYYFDTVILSLRSWETWCKKLCPRFTSSRVIAKRSVNAHVAYCMPRNLNFWICRIFTVLNILRSIFENISHVYSICMFTYLFYFIMKKVLIKTITIMWMLVKKSLKLYVFSRFSRFFTPLSFLRVFYIIVFLPFFKVIFLEMQWW